MPNSYFKARLGLKVIAGVAAAQCIVWDGSALDINNGVLKVAAASVTISQALTCSANTTHIIGKATGGTDASTLLDIKCNDDSAGAKLRYAVVRVSSDNYITAAGFGMGNANASIITGAGAGDLCIYVSNKNILFSANNGGAIHGKISSVGESTWGPASGAAVHILQGGTTADTVRIKATAGATPGLTFMDGANERATINSDSVNAFYFKPSVAGGAIGLTAQGGDWTFGAVNSGTTTVHTFRGGGGADQGTRIDVTCAGTGGSSYSRWLDSTSKVGYFGISGKTNAIITGSAAGDLCIAVTSGNTLFSGNDGGNIHAKMTTGGEWTWGPDAGGSLVHIARGLSFQLTSGTTTSTADVYFQCLNTSTTSGHQARFLARGYNGSANAEFGIYNGASAGASYAQIGSTSDITMYIITNNTLRGNISNTGIWTVGGASFAGVHQVNGGLTATYTVNSRTEILMENLSNGANGAAAFLARGDGGYAYFMKIGTGNSGYGGADSLSVLNESGGVYLTAGATSWSAISDMRHKTKVADFGNVLGKLHLLSVFTYQTNESIVAGKAPIELGLSAQEMLLVAPEIVTGSLDTKLGISYERLGVVLVRATQELKTEVDVLKEEVSILRAELDALKAAA